jgi:hypothetical protein
MENRPTTQDFHQAFQQAPQMSSAEQEEELLRFALRSVASSAEKCEQQSCAGQNVGDRCC